MGKNGNSFFNSFFSFFKKNKRILCEKKWITMQNFIYWYGYYIYAKKEPARTSSKTRETDKSFKQIERKHKKEHILRVFFIFFNKYFTTALNFLFISPFFYLSPTEYWHTQACTHMHIWIVGVFRSFDHSHFPSTLKRKNLSFKPQFLIILCIIFKQFKNVFY